MTNPSLHQLKLGQKVTVTQQIPRAQGVWTTSVSGEVVQYDQRKTGSWYAHAKGDRLWLDRLTLRKDDGEIVECILDTYTQVIFLADGPLTADIQDGDDAQDPVDPDTNESHAA